MRLLRLLALIVPALLSAAATVVVALVGAGQLKVDAFFYASVTWLALGAVVRPLVREVGAARDLSVERKVRGPLALTFRRLHEATAIPYEELGLQAYLVRGWPPLRHLVSVGRLRLTTRETSGVRWTKGKGVIGAVWASGSFQYGIAAGAPSGAFNLSDRDRQRTASYGVIAASPIVIRGNVIGCVAVDAPTHRVDDLILDEEKREQVKSELGELAASVGRLVRSGAEP